MFFPGQRVCFRRRNGEWTEGRVRGTDKEMVAVEWMSKDGKARGSKVLNQAFVKPIRSFINWPRLMTIIIFLITFFIAIDHYLNLKADLEIQAANYKHVKCGWAISDFFFSRAERCIELEKKKQPKLSIFDVILSSGKQIIQQFVIEPYNSLSYVSQLGIILSFMASILDSMATISCFAIALWFYCQGVIAINYTKVEHPAHIFIGSNYIQKIREFFINDDSIICTEKYLPIRFAMLNEEKKSIEVKAFLSQYGNLVQRQENLTTCHIYKKYYVNDEYSVLVFDNKPQLIQTSQVYKTISNEMYEKYFFSWISFKLHCYDEKHGSIYILWSIKEILFLTGFLFVSYRIVAVALLFIIRHFQYYLLYVQMMDNYRRANEMERPLILQRAVTETTREPLNTRKKKNN